jgi:biopolymer transport protein ExbB/TolQ
MHVMNEWYRTGGMIMNVILLVGIVGVGIIAERFYVIVIRAKSNGRPFIERVIQLVRVGKLDEAVKLCAGSTAALSDIGLLVLRSRSRDEADLQHVADAATLALLPKLTRRLTYLPTLAVVAPLIGIFGMLLRLGDALRVEPAAAGVALALGPLAFGILVAIVLVLGRGYLASQAEFITEQVHEFSARLINALIDRPDVRLGHR